MQIVKKPRARYIPQTGEWLVHEGVTLTLGSCFDATVSRFFKKRVERQITQIRINSQDQK